MVKHQKLWKRRDFLIALGALGSIVPLAYSRKFSYYKQVKASGERDFSVVGNASLRQRAAAKGLIYGAHPDPESPEFSQDLQLKSSFIQECAILVAGFYWSGTQPSANNFDFTETDYFAKFASDNGILFRGHPLIWHELIPQWLNDKFKNPQTTSSEIQNIFTNHISTIVKRYGGKIHSWDVVNEAIETDDGRRDGLRVNSWLNFLGPDYIELAFRIAAQADPKALLVYNDTGLEYDTPRDEARRNATLKLLERLKSKGVPIHAFGIQSHLLGHETQFNPNKLRKFLADVASLGLKILITELDVSDRELPATFAVRDRIIAGAYEDYLSVILEQPSVIAVITWGLSDKYTWLSQAAPRSDRIPVRPLPLDSSFQRKLAWKAMARAFDNAPKR